MSSGIKFETTYETYGSNRYQNNKFIDSNVTAGDFDAACGDDGCSKAMRVGAFTLTGIALGATVGPVGAVAGGLAGFGLGVCTIL